MDCSRGNYDKWGSSDGRQRSACGRAAALIMGSRQNSKISEILSSLQSAEQTSIGHIVSLCHHSVFNCFVSALPTCLVLDWVTYFLFQKTTKENNLKPRKGFGQTWQIILQCVHADALWDWMKATFGDVLMCLTLWLACYSVDFSHPLAFRCSLYLVSLKQS